MVLPLMAAEERNAKGGTEISMCSVPERDAWEQPSSWAGRGLLSQEATGLPENRFKKDSKIKNPLTPSPSNSDSIIPPGTEKP